MRLFLTLLFCFSLNLLLAQVLVYPTVNETGSDISAFVPKGWHILDQAIGDLNHDHQKDVVLVLQYNDSASLVKTSDMAADTVRTLPRIFLILFKDSSSHQFRLVQQSQTLIVTHDNPFEDEPYQGMTIKNDVLEISFQWYPTSGNWFHTSSYKFRYQDGDFYLIGQDYQERNKATHDYHHESDNFLIKTAVITDGNDFTGKRKRKNQRLVIDQLKRINVLTASYYWMELEDFK